MSNVKISELNELTVMNDTAIIPVVDDFSTKKITGNNLRNYFNSPTIGFKVRGGGPGGDTIFNGDVVYSANGGVEDFDFSNNHNPFTGQFTVPKTGLYSVFMTIRVQTGNSNCFIRINSNTTSIPGLYVATGATISGATHVGVYSTVQLTQNQNISLYVASGNIGFDANCAWGATLIG